MVVEYITGIKTAIEIAKAVKSATDSIDDAQIKLQMAELISALADAKLEAAESAETISKLKAKLAQKDKLVYEESLYYHIKDDDSRDGPFCPTCFDADQKHIRLRRAGEGWDFDWRCNVCTQVY